MTATWHRFFLLCVLVCIGLVSVSLTAVLAEPTTTNSHQTSASTPSPRAIVPRRVVGTTTNDWPQFNLDPRHSGDSPQESTISAANVASLGQLFQATLPAVADGAPAYLSQVATPNGTQDVLLVTTKAGDIVALDAHNGSQVWRQSYPAGSCLINNGSLACYTTSSPAVDPNRQYVYSYGLDGKVHKYLVGNGIEVVDGRWPQVTTLKGFDEKGSSALSTATARSGVSYLYVTNGGYPGDAGDYQGHVTAINLATGVQIIFNTLCSDQMVHFVETPGPPDCPDRQSAIWARAGVIYDATLDRILLATGNGTFSPAVHDWGDSVFSLNPDGTGAAGNPLDSYTPVDYQTLDQHDLDLGSTAPAIIPIPANCNIAPIAAQAGKDGILRVISLDNLSGQGGPGHTGGEVSTLPVPQTGEVLTQPATWVNPSDGSSWVFLANDLGISGLRLVVSVVNGTLTPSLQAIWVVGPGGSSPIVANNVLYYASSNAVRAISPTTGAPLWQGAIGAIHWESPIVVNGVLYVTDENSRLTAFAPISGPLAPLANNSIFLPFVGNGASIGC